MAIFFSATLGVSIVGLMVLIAAKRWEMTTGRILFSGVRPAAGRVLGVALHFFERRAPALLRTGSASFFVAVRKAFHVGVAWVVVQAEALLERTLQTLRHNTTEPRAGGEASPFLREVAEHKKSLLEQSGEKKNAIYEE